ncbi:MAG TPA: HIT domain-containing protein [Solirubrobacteraceae bacterium]|nr:HIT domain-containing protein [Solirubrobacteraceae bacterium]
MTDRPLWAPWRIEYITGPKDGDCIFCAAAAARHEDPAQQPIDRTEHCLTILNAFPYAPGHVMVAPVRHVGSLEDLDAREMLETMQLAQRAIRATRKAMTPDGFNVGYNLGKVAGAGIVDHLHLHVVPRWNGDTNFMPVLGGTDVMPQALAATRDVLVAAIAELR